MQIVSMTDGRMIVLSEGMAKRISKAITSGTTRLMGYILEDGTVLTTAHIVAIYNEKTDFRKNVVDVVAEGSEYRKNHPPSEIRMFGDKQEAEDFSKRHLVPMNPDGTEAEMTRDIADTDSRDTEQPDTQTNMVECSHEAISPRYRIVKGGKKMFFNLCRCGWKSKFIAKGQVENPDDVPEYSLEEVAPLLDDKSIAMSKITDIISEMPATENQEWVGGKDVPGTEQETEGQES